MLRRLGGTLVRTRRSGDTSVDGWTSGDWTCIVKVIHEEKFNLRSRNSTWPRFELPIPLHLTRRVALPIPRRVWTSSHMSKRRIMFYFLLLYLGWIGFGHFSLSWFLHPFGGSSTLVFSRTDLQKIWEWEIASGHNPSRRPIPAFIGIDPLPPNPAMPAIDPRNGTQSRLVIEEASTPGVGSARRYLTIGTEPPRVHHPPRPPLGGVADLDIVMDHCDFSTHKYVRDCLEFMRIGAGMDTDDGLRRANLARYRYIYIEERNGTGAATQTDLNVAPNRARSTNPHKATIFNRHRMEPPLDLPPPRAPNSSGYACDPDHPRIFHMFWVGPFTDKPYMALMSYLFTQNLGLGKKRDATTSSDLCRPQFWMWINPGPAASVLNPSALEDMLESLKASPWASPFLHPRFADVIKFKLWNTTEQLDGITELKDEWRAYEGKHFNSGGVVYKVKPQAGSSNGATDKNSNDLLNRVGSSSEQTYDRMSTILSDMARFVLCHRFGGIYLDADTILLRDWEDLWGWKGAFAYRWSRLPTYNTAVLHLNRGSALGTFLFRTALRNGLNFHPMTIWKYVQDAHLEGLLLRLPDALFDSAWLNTENYQRARPPFPYFTEFAQFFKPSTGYGAPPNVVGFEGFFRGAYSYHYHNSWWRPFDQTRNYPDLGPRFAEGERLAKETLLREAQVQPSKVDGRKIVEEEEATHMPWSTVLKRSFEAFVRGERANMYGEWIEW